MTRMTLRGASPALKCRAFHLTLGGVAEVWYNRLPPLSIRSWPDLKKSFLNQYLSHRKGEAPMQRLQDMRQTPGETLKSYLTRFTDEITYCEQVTDREALSALKGGLNMNTLFWRDVRSKHPATYDALVEMMRVEIVSREMIDHRNRAAQGLPPPQRQVGRGPTTHLVTQQWTQVGHTVAPTSGQALASATLNAVPVLTYENAPGEAGPSGRADSKKKKKKWSNRPLERAMFCTFHQLYGHDTSECRDANRRPDRSNPHPSNRSEYPRRSASPNRRERRHREQSPRRR
ncbi:uncharacterized protein LOC111378408 [Olea europaea var. sylvestris]|uniref:uncharacterized protein LOC111378408 n=1 Tax=Olea europaea var. sylvestris TaxID=158386 RepID=UPI000C1D481B|nr:uncharacterized protein LOC111378408 [Olea europaea var. sylvestris]